MSPKSLWNFRLTCQKLNASATPFTYREITLLSDIIQVGEDSDKFLKDVVKMIQRYAKNITAERKQILFLGVEGRDLYWKRAAKFLMECRSLKELK
jgi:hypothetical protein